MSIAMTIIGAILAVMSIASPFIQNKMAKNANKEMLEYNSPANQMERLQDAGLNPNLAATNGFNTISTVPQLSNPVESMIGGLSGMAKLYQQGMGMEFRKESNELRKTSLQIQSLKADIQYNLAQQALRKGNVDLALKMLNYDTAAQTQPAEITKAFADAGLAVNKEHMSTIDALSYDSYRDYVVENERQKGLKMGAETDYLTNVKPSLEWYKAKTQRITAEEVQKYHKSVVRLGAQKLFDMRDKDRKAYQLALDKYDEAVRMNDWEKAHYWIEFAAGILGSAAKTYGASRGILIR